MSHPGYPNPVSVNAVLERLRDAAARPHHEFWADDTRLLDARTADGAPIHSPRQITDVYLLALAVRRSGRFATFDASIAADALSPADKRHLIAI
jgi:predicted nucleic acid-binding protein